MGATAAAARIISNPARHHPAAKNTAERVAPSARRTHTKTPDIVSSTATLRTGAANAAKYWPRSPLPASCGA